jgi:hypothetical protein
MANNDSKARRLESLETLILHSSTNPNERQAAIGRWEKMSGEKWTGKPKQVNKTRRPTYADTSGDYSDASSIDLEELLRRMAARRKTNFSSDFSSGKYSQYQNYSQNTCTEKQYDFIKSISDFFRWKCPEQRLITFEEAQDFLNRYADLFKSFTTYSRNFNTLKALFEAFGINWSDTKRTFKWKAFGER